MMRAKFHSKAGELIYLLGLSARNVELLRKGAPIMFDGMELGLPNWIMIACVKRAEDMQPLVAKYEPTDGRQITGFAFTEARLDQLVFEGSMAIPLAQMGFEGAALFCYGETEQELGEQYMQLKMEPVAPGFRDVYDPLTGKMTRQPDP